MKNTTEQFDTLINDFVTATKDRFVSDSLSSAYCTGYFGAVLKILAKENPKVAERITYLLNSDIR